MALWQGKSKRKPSGGRRRLARKKRKFEIGREQHYPPLGKHRTRIYRTRGGRKKVRVLRAEWVNLLDPKSKKVKKTKIETVETNPSNPHFVQRNILTKGATVKTKMGVARITSRPGQDGVVNAILVD